MDIWIAKKEHTGLQNSGTKRSNKALGRYGGNTPAFLRTVLQRSYLMMKGVTETAIDEEISGRAFLCCTWMGYVRREAIDTIYNFCKCSV